MTNVILKCFQKNGIRIESVGSVSKILEPVPPKKGVRMESLILFSHEPTVRLKVELTGNSLKAYRVSRVKLAI